MIVFALSTVQALNPQHLRYEFANNKRDRLSIVNSLICHLKSLSQTQHYSQRRIFCEAHVIMEVVNLGTAPSKSNTNFH